MRTCERGAFDLRPPLEASDRAVGRVRSGGISLYNRLVSCALPDDGEENAVILENLTGVELRASHMGLRFVHCSVVDVNWW